MRLYRVEVKHSVDGVRHHWVTTNSLYEAMDELEDLEGLPFCTPSLRAFNGTLQDLACHGLKERYLE